MEQDFQQFVEGLAGEEWTDTLETWLPPDHWINLMVYAQNDIVNGGWFQHYGNQVINPDVYIDGCRKLGATMELAYALEARAKFPEGKYPVRTEDDVEPMDEELVAMGISSEVFAEIEARYYDATDSMEEFVQRYAAANAAELWAERIV